MSPSPIKQRGQIAIEFASMVSIATLVFVGLMAFALLLLQLRSDERTLAELRDIGSSIQSEFLLATEMHPGYQRIFTIPDSFHGNPVSVDGSENYVEVTYRSHVLSLPLPEYTGVLSTGQHIIELEEDGTLHVD